MNMLAKVAALAMMAALVSQMGAKAQPTPEGSKKMLVAYFSHTGNTRAIARQIQEATGADIFEIVPANPYPAAYADVLARGRRELKDNVMPGLKSEVPDIAPYDVIFVGSPNWFNTIAPPVMTFLSSREFSGKTIVPFVTYGGGGERSGREALGARRHAARRPGLPGRRRGRCRRRRAGVAERPQAGGIGGCLRKRLAFAYLSQRRGAVHYAGEGLGERWRMRQRLKSAASTTGWAGLPAVRA